MTPKTNTDPLEKGTLSKGDIVILDDNELSINAYIEEYGIEKLIDTSKTAADKGITGESGVPAGGSVSSSSSITSSQALGTSGNKGKLNKKSSIKENPKNFNKEMKPMTKILKADVGSIRGEIYLNLEDKLVERVVFFSRLDPDKGSALVLGELAEVNDLGECMQTLGELLDKELEK
jgi:hypothetical protein